MKFFAIIICHIIGVLLLLWLGFSLNEKISNDYAGVITVFSIALCIYSVALNILYQRSQRVHLFISRILLKFRRTHTFWLPHFHFDLEQPNTKKLFSDLEGVPLIVEG